MNIIRYHEPEVALAPFNRLENLREELDRLFEGTFGSLHRGGGLTSGWNPALDITQDKEAIHVKVELPGLKKEEIDVSLHEGVLTISGERKAESHKEEEKVYREERVFGRFQRSVSLPTAVDAGKVKASYRDGVLVIDLPKAEEAKPKQIEVDIS